MGGGVNIQKRMNVRDGAYIPVCPPAPASLRNIYSAAGIQYVVMLLLLSGTV
jgi:hypothetical protein